MTSSVYRSFNLEKSEGQRKRILRAGLITVTVSSLVLLGICFVFAGELGQRAVGDIGTTPLVRLNVVTIALNTIGLVPLSELRARRRVKTTGAAIRTSCRVLVGVSCTLWLVVVAEEGPRRRDCRRPARCRCSA